MYGPVRTAVWADGRGDPASPTRSFNASIATVSIVNTPTFETLEEFCLATNADTVENCACGQKKADELLTPNEQQLVIGLMTQNPAAMGEIMKLDDKGQVLMDKVDQFTEGCD